MIIFISGLISQNERCWSYNGISIKPTLYEADISLRRTVYLGPDGFAVKLLWKQLYKEDNYKADKRKTDTFSCPKWTFWLKIVSIKRDSFHVKRHIFFKKLFFTMVYSLIYILNDFFTAFSGHWIALTGPRNLKLTGISSP